MDLSLLSIIVLGFLLGIKHATDADHVVAVSTIVSEYKNLLRASWVGISWGIGHATTLFGVGIAVILLRLTIPDNLAALAEFAVGVVLVLLGVLTVRDLVLQRLHLHFHRHDRQVAHLHRHQAEDGHLHGHVLLLRPRSLVTGMIHGLAGSAALMLLVLSTIHSVWLGLLYIVIFDVGAILGMLLLSSVISLPFIFTAARFSRLNDAVRGLAGAISILLGLSIMVEIGLGGGLI